jgi:hypothetical protein
MHFRAQDIARTVGKPLGQQVFFEQIPYSTKQGILIIDEGIKSAYQGIPQAIKENDPGSASKV